jgi:hypothetical protein
METRERPVAGQADTVVKREGGGVKPAAFYVLLFLVLLSLAFNLLVLAGLWIARQATVQALDTSIETVSSLKGETFEMTFPVQQTIPVQTNVPFRRTMTVPVNLTIPISQEIPIRETIVIPINTALGTYKLQVPVSLTLPIDLTVPIKTEIPFTISETIPISTNVALDMSFPVAIDIGATPLAGYLDELGIMLQAIRQRLSFGLSSGKE